MLGDLSHGLAFGGNNGAAAAVGTLPTFSQFLRSGLSLPMDSGLGSVHFSYQAPLLLNNNMQFKTMNNYGGGFATYESPHAHTGLLDLSVSAKVGVADSANGMGANSFSGVHGGRGAGVTGTQPSSAMSLHLSF
jgi:hypothetical protein